MDIKIQDDYWTGTKCIENEVPWQVPESIYYLNDLCKKTDTVLEIGSGGSTLFFARRCQRVFSIETNKDQYEYIRKVLADRNIENVSYCLLSEQSHIEDVLRVFDWDFSIASVDSVHGYNRSAFLDIVLERYKNLEAIVLDNYGAAELFPGHHDLSIKRMTELCIGGSERWEGQDFDSVYWCGKGTRVLRKKVDEC